MASTSYKVEVDFALFENIDPLKAVSRPTSLEPVQIELMAPGNVHFMTGNIPEVTFIQRQTTAKSYDGNGRQEVEQEGPFAEGRSQQSRKNGRFKCRFKVGKRIKLRTGLKLRLHATLTRSVARGVDLLSNVLKLKLKDGRQTSDTTLLGRTIAGVKAGRFTPQQINSDFHVTHGVEGATGIGGRCQTKTSTTEWDVESTSAYSERVSAAGTHSNNTGLSSKIHPSCICPTLVHIPIYLSI